METAPLLIIYSVLLYSMNFIFQRNRALIPDSAAMIARLVVNALFLLTTLILLPIQQTFVFWLVVIGVWFAVTLHDRRSRPPGPFPWPIIGNTYLFASEDVSHCVMRLSKKYGDIVELWITGRRFVILSSPSHVKQVSSTSLYNLRGDVETRSLKELHLFEQGIVFNQDLGKWSLHKQWFLQGTSTSEVLKQMTETGLNHSHSLRAYVDKNCGSDVKTNLYDMLCRFLLDISFHSSFGEHLNCLNDRESEVSAPFLHFFSALRFFTLTPSIVYNTILKSQANFYRESIRALIATEMDMVNKAKDTASGSAFLNYMIKQRTIDPSISDDQIQSVLHELILGAIDTAAVACNVLWNLSHNPDAYAKLRKEIMDAKPEEGDWTMDDLQQLPYCDQVINETIRLTPASPLTGRMNTEDDVVSGFLLPKHTNVFLNFERIHQDERYWKDPMSFNPDRFNNESPESVSRMSAKWQFLPFGGGARGCAGKRIAILLLKTVLVSLATDYDVQFQEKELKRVWEGVRIPLNSEDWVTISPLTTSA